MRNFSHHLERLIAFTESKKAVSSCFYWAWQHTMSCLRVLLPESRALQAAEDYWVERACWDVLDMPSEDIKKFKDTVRRTPWPKDEGVGERAKENRVLVRRGFVLLKHVAAYFHPALHIRAPLAWTDVKLILTNHNIVVSEEVEREYMVFRKEIKVGEEPPPLAPFVPHAQWCYHWWCKHYTRLPHLAALVLELRMETPFALLGPPLLWTLAAGLLVTTLFGLLGTWRALGGKAAPLLRNE